MQLGTYDGRVLAGTTSVARLGLVKKLASRLVTVALLGLMMIGGFGLAAPEAAVAGQAAMINTNGVEIFEHPTDLSVIGYVGYGDWVDIFWGPEFEMYEIRSGDGTIGWVWAEFVDIDGGGSSSESSSEETWTDSSSSSADEAGVWAWSAWAMVDADSLNVRSDASSSASVMDQFGPGEWIEVIGNDVNGFSPINYYGDVGWVSAKYLSWDGNYNYASVSTGASSSSSGGAGGGSSTSTSSEEHWIDVNGATGEVNLMVGNSVLTRRTGVRLASIHLRMASIRRPTAPSTSTRSTSHWDTPRGPTPTFRTGLDTTRRDPMDSIPIRRMPTAMSFRTELAKRVDAWHFQRERSRRSMTSPSLECG